MQHHAELFPTTSLTSLGLALFLLLPALRGLGADAAGTNNLSNWPARMTPKEVGQKVADYMVPRWQAAQPSDPNVQDFVWLLQYAKQTGTDSMRLQLVERIEPLLAQFEANPDCLRRRADHSMFGAALFEVYIQTGKPRYLTSGRLIADRQWKEPQAGGLPNEARFRAEDMYFITALQIQAFRATTNFVYQDRAALALSVCCDKLQDGSGLFRHGEGAPHWGRANGFASVALVMLLSDLPAAHAQRGKLMAAYTRMMAAAIHHQSDKGLWNQLIDVPDSYGESSGTALLTCALAAGVKHGWLASDTDVYAVRKGWLSLMDKVGNSGKVYQVSVPAEPTANASDYLNLPAQRGGREGQVAVLCCALTLLKPDPQKK
jgi:unsaturated rhamnogalacturonyl hydrolase